MLYIKIVFTCQESRDTSVSQIVFPSPSAVVR